MLIKNKNILILGATGGVGKSVANLLIKKSNFMYIHGNNLKKLTSLKQSFSNSNQEKIHIVQCDLSLLNDVNSMLDNLKNSSQIDIIINCAATFNVNDYQLETNEAIIRSTNINLISPMLIEKELSKKMKINRWGRIINITSSSAYTGFSGTVSYCTSKHGLLGFTRSLHAELREYGVRVLSIAPGSIKTEMGKKVLGQDYTTFIEPEELAKLIAEVIDYDGNMVADEIRVGRMHYK